LIIAWYVALFVEFTDHDPEVHAPEAFTVPVCVNHGLLLISVMTPTMFSTTW
jgi:hypothetical protein